MLRDAVFASANAAASRSLETRFGSVIGDLMGWLAHAVMRAVVYRTVFGLHGGVLAVVGLVALVVAVWARLRRRRRGARGNV